MKWICCFTQFPGKVWQKQNECITWWKTWCFFVFFLLYSTFPFEMTQCLQTMTVGDRKQVTAMLKDLGLCSQTGAGEVALQLSPGSAWVRICVAQWHISSNGWGRRDHLTALNWPPYSAKVSSVTFRQTDFSSVFVFSSGLRKQERLQPFRWLR